MIHGGARAQLAGEYSIGVAKAFVDGAFVCDVVYGSASLANESAGLVDLTNSTPRTDPNFLMRTSHVVLNWGEHGHPLKPDLAGCEVVIFSDTHRPINETDRNSSREAQEIILGATIGISALANVTGVCYEAVTGYRQQSGGRDLARAVAANRSRAGAPVGAVAIGRVLRSKTAPFNARVALMRYPVPTEPIGLLAAIQASLRRIEL